MLRSGNGTSHGSTVKNSPFGMLLAYMDKLMLFASDVLDQLPQDVVEQLPTDVRQKLEDGTLDKIPEDVINNLPADLVDKVPTSLIDFASANPLFTGILLIIGVLAVIGLFYGVIKSAVKVAITSGITAAGAWYLFFQQ